MMKRAQIDALQKNRRDFLKTNLFVAAAFVSSLFAATGGETAEPKAIYAPKPEYPFEARSRHMTGSGVVALTVDPANGNVTDATMARSIGSPILDNAAVSTFRHWRFEPRTPSKIWIDITYTMTGASYGLARTQLASLKPQLVETKSPPPNRLAQEFAILTRTYHDRNPKWFVRPPADSAWIFSAFNSSVGTVEVGFQGDNIVYMVFRRGVGGLGWKQRDIDSIHDFYCRELLQERECGDTYRSFVVPQINAAVIVRRDFDVKNLL
jgi:TonB family protein